MNPGWLSALSGQYTLIECKDGRRENNSSGGHSANILVGQNTRPATACPVAGLGVVLELAGLVESSDSPGGIRATGQSCCQPTIKLVTQPASPSRLESGAATPTSPLQHRSSRATVIAVQQESTGGEHCGDQTKTNNIGWRTLYRYCCRFVDKSPSAQSANFRPHSQSSLQIHQCFKILKLAMLWRFQ